MRQTTLDHYRAFSQFTAPGLYQERLQRDLPTNLEQTGRLVKRQVIHSVVLSAGRAGAETNPVYGNIIEAPWYRQGEDDYFPTAVAILAELYRRDPRGFVPDRAVADKLVITCRGVALLMASILKSRGIPARVRAGYAPYLRPHADTVETHWITQYWRMSEERWMAIDADTSLEQRPFDPFNMPPGAFGYAADIWLALREGRQAAGAYAVYGVSALENVATQLFFDFHCLMNNEITYLQSPVFIALDFDTVEEQTLQEIDILARLMRQPDDNFERLYRQWETRREFRLLRGSLV